MKIILASGSPRRKEILEQAGYRFSVEVSEADENVDLSGMEPGTIVEELSLRKASAVAQTHKGEKDDCKIIGSDTIVVLDGEILGKPVDEKDAAAMLRKLSGRAHEVYTGVTVITIVGGRTHVTEQFYECTKVRMRDITEEEIAAYIHTGEPMDKAGAYGIQGRAAIFISGIEGDYYNVVGLPICRLAMIL